MAKLVAVDGLAFNQISSSKILRRAFAANGYSLSTSRYYVKKVFMQQFAEIQSKIVTKICEIKETNNRFSISLDESTSTRNRRFINFNLHFPVGLQSLGLIRVKGRMVTERAIELVQERLHKYALSLNDNIVTTITNGASIMMKFGRETEPLHFSCLAHAIHLSVCDVLHTEMPKQIVMSIAMVVVLVTLQPMTKVTEKIILRKNLMNKNVMKNSRIVLISFQKSKKLSKK